MLWGLLYPLTEQELKVLWEWLDQMVAEQKIQRSKSAVGALIVLVRKANGEFRLCVDYRGLNKVTLKNRYPIPLMFELKERLNRAKIFTKLDLKNSYYLIRMAKGDEPKTAFYTRFGLYEWKVMPFGLCNTPATLQVMIDDLFHDMLDEVSRRMVTQGGTEGYSVVGHLCCVVVA